MEGSAQEQSLVAGLTGPGLTGPQIEDGTRKVVTHADGLARVAHRLGSAFEDLSQALGDRIDEESAGGRQADGGSAAADGGAPQNAPGQSTSHPDAGHAG